jgi:hypothetical protein
MLREVIHTIDEISALINKLITQFQQDDMISMLSFISNLNILVVFTLNAVNANPNDVFYQKPNSADWKMLESIVEIEVILNIENPTLR